MFVHNGMTYQYRVTVTMTVTNHERGTTTEEQEIHYTNILKRARDIKASKSVDLNVTRITIEFRSGKIDAPVAVEIFGRQ